MIMPTDQVLSRSFFHYYGRLNKRDMYVCREVLYSIWDLGDGYYDNIVANLVKEHKRLFATRRKVYPTIQRLVDKGIVKCKIYFRESRTDGLLKPKRILSLCKDMEIDAMSFLGTPNEKIAIDEEDDVYDNYIGTICNYGFIAQ